MGQKPKLNAKLQERIVSIIRTGAYDKTACELAGISTPVFYEWLQRGRGEHPSRPLTKLYVDFANAIEKAHAEAELFHIANIRKHASDGTWQASAWFLERKYPARWGRKFEVTGPGGGPIQQQVISIEIPPDTIREALAILGRSGLALTSGNSDDLGENALGSTIEVTVNEPSTDAGE